MAGSHQGHVQTAIYAAFIGNLIIAILKLIAAIQSGSSGLLAETAHSFADAGNHFILLIGVRLAMRPASPTHPFGYGKDRYFWTFLAAVSMFVIGATFSIFHGVQSLTGHQEEIGDTTLAYGVLAAATVLEIIALALALRATWPEMKKLGVWKAIRETKDPTSFIVVLEDSAALIGIFLAAAGLILAQLLGLTFFDGIAAILIGVLLAGVAIILGYESRSLLLGESVSPAVRREIIAAITAHPQVNDLIDLQTMHLGPEQVLVGIEVHLKDDMTTDAVEQVVDEIERAVREIIPMADHMFVEAKPPATA